MGAQMPASGRPSRCAATSPSRRRPSAVPAVRRESGPSAQEATGSLSIVPTSPAAAVTGSAGPVAGGQTVTPLPEVTGGGADAIDNLAGQGQAARTVTIAPKSMGCGGYDMGAIFSVAGTAPLNGYVVQKIHFDQKRSQCSVPDSDVFQKTYWEAWQVRDGVVYIGTSTARHDSDGVGDRFRASPRLDRRGYQFCEGWAKYIDGYTEPSSWGHIPEAGSLPSTTSAPTSWSDEGTIYRNIRSEFDCCNQSDVGRLTSQS
jgi:hypothetical protein